MRRDVPNYSLVNSEVSPHDATLGFDVRRPTPDLARALNLDGTAVVSVPAPYLASSAG